MACLMEDGISMATKRQITLRFRDEYMKASKKDKGRILDEMCSVLAIGRSTARRRLAEAGRGRPSPPPTERPKRYSEQSRDLLVRVWPMMDLPCAKYLKAMLPTWLPMLRAHGELADYDGFAFRELERMSSATMDRYLEKTRDAARPRGTVPTRPAGELLRDSITIRKAGDELDGLPGDVEADRGCLIVCVWAAILEGLNDGDLEERRCGRGAWRRRRCRRRFGAWPG